MTINEAELGSDELETLWFRATNARLHDKPAVPVDPSDLLSLIAAARALPAEIRAREEAERERDASRDARDRASVARERIQEAFDDHIFALHEERAARAASEARATAAEQRAEEMEEAIRAVRSATCAYLPPDGIDASECISRVLTAMDNPTINAVLPPGESNE